MTTITPALYNFEGYKLTVRGTTDKPVVSVFDPRFPKDPAIYVTTSLDLAMEWTRAYKAGEQWAVASALPSGTESKANTPPLLKSSQFGTDSVFRVQVDGEIFEVRIHAHSLRKNIKELKGEGPDCELSTQFDGEIKAVRS